MNFELTGKEGYELLQPITYITVSLSIYFYKTEYNYRINLPHDIHKLKGKYLNRWDV